MSGVELFILEIQLVWSQQNGPDGAAKSTGVEI